jgi:hypothetical protein
MPDGKTHTRKAAPPGRMMDWQAGFWAWMVFVLPIIVLLCAAAVSLPAVAPFMTPISAAYGAAAVIGGTWVVYDALRYEERPWRFILGAMIIPMFFVWYYVGCARRRSPADRIPVRERMGGM